MKESTSSSFMIILAKIIDMKLAKKWLVTKKLDYNKYIKTIKDIENLITFYNYSWGGGPDIAKEIVNIDRRRKYFLFELLPQEGNWAFRRDYKIELNYFHKDIVSLYNEDLTKHGMEIVCKSFGAGRNINERDN